MTRTLHVLHVIASPDGEASHSTRLGRELIKRLGSVKVTRRDLCGAGALGHLTAAQVAAFQVPETEQTPEQRAACAASVAAIKQLREADVLVLSSPLWNFGVPSAVKAWIDHVVRAGLTFQYGEGGPVGLLQGKAAHLCLSSGGIYSTGSMQHLDFATPYLTGVLRFIGITTVDVHRVEGLSMAALKGDALKKAIEKICVKAAS